MEADHHEGTPKTVVGQASPLKLTADQGKKHQ